jgi:hypothetical protein
MEYNTDQPTKETNMELRYTLASIWKDIDNIQIEYDNNNDFYSEGGLYITVWVRKFNVANDQVKDIATLLDNACGQTQGLRRRRVALRDCGNCWEIQLDIEINEFCLQLKPLLAYLQVNAQEKTQ